MEVVVLLGVPLRELEGGSGWRRTKGVEETHGTSGVVGSEGGGGRLMRVGALEDIVCGESGIEVVRRGLELLEYCNVGKWQLQCVVVQRLDLEAAAK